MSKILLSISRSDPVHLEKGTSWDPTRAKYLPWSVLHTATRAHCPPLDSGMIFVVN